ncbi:hypothetical protein [Aeromicrobium sp.]|uniref:hypothetical protein n=1 Tax=Aeromicrobium sp. TaxID=1871063 RepID=UPI0028ABE459|nr:hypothetical protein [Aeromicrobium sp.]
MTPRTRLLLMLPAGVSLLAGLDAALLLLDLPAPVRTERLPDVHGIVLVLGFVGTLVSLERAVALRRPWGFLAPGLLGVGSLLLLSPAPMPAGRTAMVAGTAALVAVYVPLWRRQRDDAVLVQLLGAAIALGGAAIWAGGATTAAVVPWLAGFVILTIGGERLELARLQMGPGAGTRLIGLAVAFVCAIVACLLWPSIGEPLLGATLLVLTVWLATHDVARRTISATGQTRFMAACMLAGYGWLVVASAVWLTGSGGTNGVPEGSGYDAVIHAVFLGFTISMIMAHASVILPAVLRRPLPHHRAMWVPAALLHGALVLRVWVGDGLGVERAWQVGGALNVAALLLFVGVAVWSALTAEAARRPVAVAR